MKKAQKRKSSLFASLCLLVAALGLAENRAWGFFVPTGPASLLIYEVVEDDGTTVAARYDYDPFGRVEKLSGSYDVDFLYTGHLYQRPSDLHLTHYRAYDPNTGLWLSRDPLGYVDGPNPYAYVLNNPVNFIDPTGEAVFLLIWLAFEAGSTAYDVYYMLTTVLDDCASQEEKENAVAALGIFGPGGGYGRILNASKRGQKVGGSGKVVSPTAKHPTHKRAKDAAQAETAKGKGSVHHKAKDGKPPHYHAVDSKGKLKKKHHDYPKP